MTRWLHRTPLRIRLVAAVVGLAAAFVGWSLLYWVWEDTPATLGLAAGLGFGAGTLVSMWLRARRRADGKLMAARDDDAEYEEDADE